MLPLIESKKAEIAALCRQHHVRRLDVFGSAARGADPHPERSEAQSRDDPGKSDIDFLVEFLPQPPPAYADNYFGLMEDLATLFRTRHCVSKGEPACPSPLEGEGSRAKRGRVRGKP